MFWRSVWLAACLALTVGNAQAQERLRVAGPEGLPLTVGPFGPTTGFEDILAQLNDAIANYDNSGISIRDGVAHMGDEVATREMPYEAARRLRNDVSRSGAFGGRVLLLPAGSPLYSFKFINGDLLFVNGTARMRELWCGANGTRGYCLIRRSRRWEAAEVRSESSPYAPMELGPFVPVNDAEVEVDDTVFDELPHRSETYRLAGMRGSTATIARSIRVGDAVIDVDEFQARQMRLGSLMVEIAPGAEPDTALVSYAALDTSNYRDELQHLARGLLHAPP